MIFFSINDLSDGSYQYTFVALILLKKEQTQEKEIGVRRYFESVAQ
jgi:hypothetical protein